MNINFDYSEDQGGFGTFKNLQSILTAVSNQFSLLPPNIGIGTLVPNSSALYIDLSNVIGTYYKDYPITVDTSVFTTNATTGGGAVARFIGDGTHNLAFNNIVTIGSFDKTLNKINLCTFLYDGSENWCSIQNHP